MKLWLVRDGAAENTRRAAALLAERFPDREIETVAADDSRRGGEAQVIVPWRGRPWSIGPVAHALRWRRHQVSWLDEAGGLGSCGFAFLLREGVRLALLRCGDALLRGLAAALAAREAPRHIAGAGAAADGAPVFVLPVLPDLSHTFVYREVLAAIGDRDRSTVVCLERGVRAPVHDEAAALLGQAEFVARRGVVRRRVDVLRWMLRHPRRTGRILALYRAREGGSLRDLFGKEPLRDPRHPGNAFALASMLRGRRISHLHVYSSSYATNVVMGAAILLDLPFSISSYVDFDFDYDFRMLAEKQRLARFFRVCTGFCQRRLVATLGLEDGSDVPVIYWGLDLSDWHERARPSDAGVIVSAGRIVEKKGLHLVPAALAKAAAAGVQFRWVLIGDGPGLSGIRLAVRDLGIEDRVEFLGPQSNSVVRARLGTADLAMLPCVVAADGERDGIPIFLIEAMALGVPVLTTPVSGIPEVVRDGDTGFLAPEGDVDALAERLIAVLRDDAARHGVGARGRDEVRATQDVRRSVAELWHRIDAAQPDSPGGEAPRKEAS